MVVFSVFLHELGHAHYMSKYGVPIKTFSIGFPFPLKISFRSKKILNGAKIQITPLIILAYVQPTDEGATMMLQLPY